MQLIERSLLLMKVYLVVLILLFIFSLLLVS